VNTISSATTLYTRRVLINLLWDLTFGDGNDPIRTNEIDTKKHNTRWYERGASAKGYNHFKGLYEQWNFKKYPI